MENKPYQTLKGIDNQTNKLIGTYSKMKITCDILGFSNERSLCADDLRDPRLNRALTYGSIGYLFIYVYL